MLRAWRRIFERLDQPAAIPAQDPGDVARERERATLQTPLTALGMSARATNALERQGAVTVADLLAIPRFELIRLRGVGMVTRTELVDLQRQLRDRLGTQEPRFAATSRSTTEAEPDVQRLDAFVAQMLPKRTSRNASEIDSLRLLLGLEATFTPAGDWASQTEVAQQREVTRARVGQIAAKARERWRRLPSMTRLRDELVAHIAQLGGVAGTRELELLVTAERGSGDSVADGVFATAVVRAAVETEGPMGDQRLTVRRTGRRVVIGVKGATPEQRQLTVDYAVRLGAAADDIARAETLPGPAEVAERLRAIRSPEHMSLTQERLVQVAAAASEDSAVSARLELYPRGLPAGRALALGRAALLGAAELTAEEVHHRIAARFPEAEALPVRPVLDEALREAGLDLRFDAARHAYLAPVQDAATGLTSLQSSGSRQATASITRPPTQLAPEIVEAHAFEARLDSAIASGGMLTLMVAPGRLRRAAAELRRFPVTAVDVDGLLIRHLHAAADSARVRWDLVLRVDADPAAADWAKLVTLVSRAMPGVQKELTSTIGTVLLENAGLLARYGQLRLVDELRAEVMRRGQLRGCWLLVPSDQQVELPLIDGQPVPVLTRNEWARIPEPWLENRHRSMRPSAGAA